MASTYTLTSARFPNGTTVYANPADDTSDESSVAVMTDGEATFTGLRELQEYVAHATIGTPDADGGGTTFVQVSFTTDGGTGGSGVLYVPTDADLPATATLGQVVLVLEDSTNLDEDDNPQATLRYGNGTQWVPLGLATGGTVGGGTEGDFIVLDVNLAGRHDGDTLIFDADTDLYVPGGFS